MNIQRVSLQNTNQNVNFKAKINAPEEFWLGVRRAPELVARRALTKILEKPGSEQEVINIKVIRLPRWFYDNYIWKNFYKVEAPSKRPMLRETLGVSWNKFLPEIARKFAPAPKGQRVKPVRPVKTELKPLDELIAAVKA